MEELLRRGHPAPNNEGEEHVREGNGDRAHEDGSNTGGLALHGPLNKKTSPLLPQVTNRQERHDRDDAAAQLPSAAQLSDLLARKQRLMKLSPAGDATEGWTGFHIEVSKEIVELLHGDGAVRCLSGHLGKDKVRTESENIFMVDLANANFFCLQAHDGSEGSRTCSGAFNRLQQFSSLHGAPTALCFPQLLRLASGLAA